MLVRKQMIDDLDPVLVIDSALIRKTVHRKLGILEHEASDLDDCALVNYGERIRLLVYCFENAIAEPILDPLEYLERFHAYAAATRLPLLALGARESQRSVIIFSCSLSKPSVSASGRGGQPGTYTSTGRILSTPSQTEYASWNSPPQLAHEPIEM